MGVMGSLGETVGILVGTPYKLFSTPVCSPPSPPLPSLLSLPPSHPSFLPPLSLLSLLSLLFLLPFPPTSLSPLSLLSLLSFPGCRQRSATLFSSSQDYPFSLGQHQHLVQYLTAVSPLSTMQMVSIHTVGGQSIGGGEGQSSWVHSQTLRLGEYTLAEHL